MTNCRELVELLTDYLEGRLPLGRRLALGFHLAICGHCRRYLRQTRLTIRATGALPDEPIPDEVAEALRKVFESTRRSGPES